MGIRKTDFFTTSCPTSDTLAQLLDGTIEDAKVLEDHLKSCSQCQSRLDELSQSEVLSPFRKSGRLHVGSKYSYLDVPLRANDLGSINEFRVQAEIGRGGVGVVFKAYDPSVERYVAVKVLTHDGSFRSEARFERESKAAGKLRNDHLVSVHSIGRTKDDRPYLVMPLIEGPTLKAYLKRQLPGSRESASIIRQIALGLDAVHAAGLVHRDVKSANILMDQDDNRAKLTDFGLARAEITEETLTQADVLCGTPEYMSPEQAGGTDSVSAASDIYSLGITLYECLTGTTPFQGQPLQVLEQHRQTEPIRPSRLNPSVPRDLENICQMAMAKHPERRYQSSRAFADDLQRFLDGRPVVARETTRLERLRMWCGRNRGVAALTATSLALLLVLAIGSSTAAWQLNLSNKSISREKQKATAAEELALKDRAAAIDSLATLVDSLYDELTNDAATIKTREKIVTAAINGLRSITEVEGDRKADRTTFLAYLRIADLASLRGANQEAESSYDKAIELGRNLLTQQPEDAASKRELALAMSKLGSHYFKLGNAKAAELSQQSAELLDEILDENPNDFEALARLVVEHGQQLQIIRQAFPGDTAKVIDYGESVLADVDRLFEQPHNSSTACQAAHTIHFCIGRAYLEANNAAKAESHFEAARPYLDQALEQLPGNVEFRAASAVLDRAQGMAMASQGHVNESSLLFQRALTTLTELSDANPDDLVQRRNVANTQNIMSEQLVVLGRLEAAIELLNGAVAIYQSLLELSPEDESTRILIADSRLKAAFCRLNLHRWADANEACTELLQELNDYEFGEASAAMVELYTTLAGFVHEATDRLLGRTMEVKTPTGEMIALLQAARKDAHTAPSNSLLEETIALTADINPEFKGITFGELFAHLDTLTEVHPVFVSQRKLVEAMIYGFLARNSAKSGLPEAIQFSEESLNRSVSLLVEAAAAVPGAREIIQNDSEFEWVRQTPEFAAAWADMEKPNN